MPATHKDFATGKLVDINKPEEVVRQQYEQILHKDLGYPKNQMGIGVPIKIGSKTCFCDIAIYDQGNIIGIVETKAPGTKLGNKQLRSYMSATPTCYFGVSTNSEEVECAVRDPKTNAIKFDSALSVPRYKERYATVQSYADLQPASDLKWVFKIINNALYANTNLARSEKQGAEMVRLLFCKLTDEHRIRDDSSAAPDFQVKLGESRNDTRKRINQLWEETKKGWTGNPIFDRSEKIEIDNYSLGLIISKLQGYSLLKTDRDVVGDAFQVFSEKQFAGEKGQYFTPREVVKMTVSMVDPKKTHTIIDPACGSGGFLIDAWEHITRNVRDGDAKRRIAEHCLYGIDKEGDLAKICKAHMSIIGDGKSNIAKEDSLKDPKEWGPEAKSKLLEDGDLRQFDICLTNPPFGKKIKVERHEVLRRYDLGHKWVCKEGVWEKTAETKPTPPQILFIELCMRLLKPGGKLGIVLPDGLLGNRTDGYIRHWLNKRAQILAVVDCPVETFSPFTSTKTSVLVVQKLPGQSKVKPFFAIAENCGHTMRGTPTGREDFTAIAENYLHQKSKGHLGFYPARLHDGIVVPRYYDPRILREIRKLEKSGDTDMLSIEAMEEQGLLEVLGVSGSAKSEEYDLHGEVRYIRTSDIAEGYELADHTQKMVAESTFQRYKEKQDMRKHDILFVKDGDHRIGKTAMLLDEHDTKMLVQGHFYKIRPKSIDPFLLIYLLNTKIVFKQIRQRVFNQSTLSTIGQRIKELRLPVPVGHAKQAEISSKIKKLMHARRENLRKLQRVDE